MNLTTESTTNRDPRAVKILAATIYRELRANGYGEREVMSLAGELLSQVSHEVRERRGKPDDVG
jgi:hypothetical protein